MEINVEYIIKILQNCPNVNFSPNSDGVIKNSQLSAYINKQAKALEFHLEEVYQQTHTEKISYEVNNAQKNLAILCPLFLELSVSI